MSHKLSEEIVLREAHLENLRQQVVDSRAALYAAAKKLTLTGNAESQRLVELFEQAFTQLRMAKFNLKKEEQRLAVEYASFTKS